MYYILILHYIIVCIAIKYTSVKYKGFIAICSSKVSKEPEDKQLCKTVNNNKNSNNLHCLT